MRGGRSSDTSVNKLLTEVHAESPMALSSSPKSNIFKAGNQLTDYVSNITHDQKHKTKITFINVYFKRKFIFKVKEFSFYF